MVDATLCLNEEDVTIKQIKLINYPAYLSRFLLISVCNEREADIRTLSFHPITDYRLFFIKLVCHIDHSVRLYKLNIVSNRKVG